MHRVLLADDHRIVCDGIRALLDDSRVATVVGVATTGDEAVSLARSLTPDVVILDIAMRGLNGIEATRQIRVSLPECRIIMLTMHSTTAHVRSAFDAGAHGYLLKESAADETVAAIAAVTAGARFVCSRARELGIDAVDPLAALSERERQVLYMMIDGRTCAETAGKLGLSSKTVETYRSRSMGKLGLHDTQDLMRFALRHNLTAL
jgi:DNA-binding NarL/FixJ family response regulator